MALPSAQFIYLLKYSLCELPVIIEGQGYVICFQLS